MPPKQPPKSTPAQQGPVLSSIFLLIRKSFNSRVLMQLKKFKIQNHKNIVLIFVNNFVSLIKISKKNKNFLHILSNSDKDSITIGSLPKSHFKIKRVN